MFENENLWRSMSLDQDLSIENAQDFLVCLVWGFFSPRGVNSISPGILIACLSWLAQKQYHRGAVKFRQLEAWFFL